MERKSRLSDSRAQAAHHHVSCCITVPWLLLNLQCVFVCAYVFQLKICFNCNFTCKTFHLQNICKYSMPCPHKMFAFTSFSCLFILLRVSKFFKISLNPISLMGFYSSLNSDYSSLQLFFNWLILSCFQN